LRTVGVHRHGLIVVVDDGSAALIPTRCQRALGDIFNVSVVTAGKRADTYVDNSNSKSFRVGGQGGRRTAKQDGAGDRGGAGRPLIVDGDPKIVEDTLALVLLGDLADELVEVHRDRTNAEDLARMRVAITTRSRYTEDRLAEAVRRGIGQCVLLGAGLDSFAYRSSWAGRFRVFEVDHPATQAWKRERLTAASISVPRGVAFVSVDFRVAR
jgi:hypothetical protein